MKYSEGKEYTTAQAITETNPESQTYTNGTIYIYSTKLCLGQKPITLIHETLHVLGLDHSAKFGFGEGQSNDIMSDVNTNCYADITQEEIDFLKGIYSK